MSHHPAAARECAPDLAHEAAPVLRFFRAGAACYTGAVTLPGRPAADSRAETTHLVLPGLTNVHGTIFGGFVMQWIDEIAAVSAVRHVGGSVVTAAVDALHFLAPIQLGALVVMKAQVNAVGRTSMEIGVRVEVEDPRTRARRRTTKAYLTFVAVDEDGRPREMAPLTVATEEERRRQAQADARRRARLAARPGG
ncbi:MAG: acyl-CoA thioesterase [Myxococcales bacterium]|nr:acyl-CoA thioesterase [Myxococcales bacterium]